MWKRLCKPAGKAVTTGQLNLKNTLMNGQCFNWRELGSNTYVGIVDRNVILMREQAGSVEYNFLHKFDTELLEEEFLNTYFQLEIDIAAEIIKLDLPDELSEITTRITGVRIIKQDVFECILSFICSSNNNIDRIRKMLESFRQLYGKLLISDNEYGDFYSFPDLTGLASIDEQTLRDKGFGYRAKYMVKSLEYIREHDGMEWIKSLGNLDDPTEELINLLGVGQKVADCIALFSLKKHHVVPLDVHMINFYNESVVGLDESFIKIDKGSKKSFKNVAENYIKVFGNYAGWLHSIFFMNRIDKSNKKENKSKNSDKTDSKKYVEIEEVKETSKKTKTKSKKGKRKSE
jgi:N-glycosylase/DNA lyase